LIEEIHIECEYFIRRIGFTSLPSTPGEVFAQKVLSPLYRWSFEFSHLPSWTLSPNKCCLTSFSHLFCVANRVAAVVLSKINRIE